MTRRTVTGIEPAPPGPCAAAIRRLRLTLVPNVRAVAMALCLAWIPVARSQSLDYVTPNRSLAELERSMTGYYLQLERDHQLPVQRVTDDLGLRPEELIYRLGLLRGREDKPEFPEKLAALLQRLNPRLWRNRADGSMKWVNRKGDTFCLPAVVWKDALTLVRVKVPTSADPVAAIDARLGTCAVLGADCRDKLTERLRSPDAQGTVAVAALAQGALRPETNMPTSCADAPTVPVSAKLDVQEPPSTKESTAARAAAVRNRERMAEADTEAREWARAERPSTNDRQIRNRSATSAARPPKPTRRDGIVPLDLSPSSRHQASAPARERFERGIVQPRYETAAVPAEALQPEPAEAPAPNVEIVAEPMETTPPTASAPEPAWDDTSVSLANAPDTDPAAPHVSTETVAPAPSVEPALPPATTAAAVPEEHIDFVPHPLSVVSSAESLDMANYDNPALQQAGLKQHRLPLAGARKVGVLVFDTAVKGCHFVLRQAFPRCVPTAGSATAPGAFWLLPKPTKADHGAHICGLIAGGFGIGVYPGAPIQSVELISGAGDSVFDLDMEQKVSSAVDEFANKSRVANFSLDLNAKDHLVSQRLADALSQEGSILVVAAAGDRPGPLTNDCDVLPACLSLGASDNLAVVGGVQKSQATWQLWPNSSYGDKVHLLAPAVGIVSAVALNGWLGSMDGTSQSAAIVSGLAARLFTTKPPPASNWSPAQVRNRLMATAQISRETLGWSRSGVVDGDRALETDVQVLRRKTATGSEWLRGRIVKMVDPLTGKKLDSNDIEIVLQDGTSASYDYCRLYRISRVGPGNSWVFGYQPRGIQSVARWASMELHGGATLTTFSKTLLFQPVGANEPVQVPVGDVLDFYDEFSGRLACPE